MVVKMLTIHEFLISTENTDVSYYWFIPDLKDLMILMHRKKLRRAPKTICAASGLRLLIPRPAPHLQTRQFRDGGESVAPGHHDGR